MKIDLDAIRADHPIASVAGSAVVLKRSGNELAGLCPFHQEKGPSFYVYANVGAGPEDRGRSYRIDRGQTGAYLCRPDGDAAADAGQASLHQAAHHRKA